MLIIALIFFFCRKISPRNLIKYSKLSDRTWISNTQVSIKFLPNTGENYFLWSDNWLMYLQHSLAGGNRKINFFWQTSETKWAATWQNQQSECAPSEDSDQPGHPPSLIRVFSICMNKHWFLSYPLSPQRRLWSDWADAQADLSLCWAHSQFVGFVMLWLKYSIMTYYVTHRNIYLPVFSSTLFSSSNKSGASSAWYPTTVLIFVVVLKTNKK